MVSGTLALALALFASTGPGAPADAVGSALGNGSFPWYDASKDEIKPLSLPADPEVSTSGPKGSSRPGWKVGDFIAFAGFAIAIGVLLALLIWFYRLYEPSAEAELAGSPRAGRARAEQLPAGLRREFDSDDPWSEALRRRDRGDLAGAVVCLFAHQLLTLSRLGLVQLSPGKTGRQLVRSVSDADFRALILATLRQFEAAYYGHHGPTAGEFAAVWAAAEAFERRVAAGGVAA